MIVFFLRTLVLYLLLVGVIRLMGKRQVGQMEPAEFFSFLQKQKETPGTSKGLFSSGSAGRLCPLLKSIHHAKRKVKTLLHSTAVHLAETISPEAFNKRETGCRAAGIAVRKTVS